MPTLVCVPIMVESVEAALAEGRLAAEKGADLVEWRIDPFFAGAEGDAEDGYRLAQLQKLLADSPLPCILTCRSAEEGGDYDGDDADRVSLLEKLCCASERPPAYLDFELAAYTRSANIRQKINLCVAHPKQQRDVTTKLILSIHDFDGRPADLDRRLLTAYDEPACSVVKVAYRARSIRDNLDLFEITSGAIKPTIALGMGEFGLMSRVLAPKFGGYLTFASLRDEAATAPGQPTIDELLGMYRFRSIGRETKVYGVIGWPVTQSLSPLVHNAGFAEVGWDGVYLPMPVVADPKRRQETLDSFKATFTTLLDAEQLSFMGASITMPFKDAMVRTAKQLTGVHPRWSHIWPDSTGFCTSISAANTFYYALRHDIVGRPGKHLDGFIKNTDADAIFSLVRAHLHPKREYQHVAVVGTGGVARAAVARIAGCCGTVTIANRTIGSALLLAKGYQNEPVKSHLQAKVVACTTGELSDCKASVYINCTPVGMAGGPDPEGLSIPESVMDHCSPDTVFFDTVYNPVETPMLREARRRGFKTIDGVDMFVRQAAEQFEVWTGYEAPVELFDRLCRERLGGAS